MRILAIETSCDETAVSIVDASGGIKRPTFKILGSITLSQAKIHAHYGGVFPAIAKREHSRSLVPILKEALVQAFRISNVQYSISKQFSKSQILKIKKTLEREPELLEQFLEFVPTIAKPKIDAIAVTYGPGLEPTLWVGINFAKALSLVWNIPVIPVNHMEGHASAALIKVKTKKPVPTFAIEGVRFPILALLVSGGHTELVLMNNLLSYKVVGETHDDAVGEAFDKVARMLGLPYPGGPEISKMASRAAKTEKPPFPLPRPMLHSGDFNFSFSGLKTAVLYTIKKIPDLTPEIKASIAKEFEEAATDVLVQKTMRAAEMYGAKTVIVGGGVAANQALRKKLGEAIRKLESRTTLLLSEKELSTDNAVMIALAGYLRSLSKGKRGASAFTRRARRIKAVGNLRL